MKFTQEAVCAGPTANTKLFNNKCSASEKGLIRRRKPPYQGGKTQVELFSPEVVLFLWNFINLLQLP